MTNFLINITSDGELAVPFEASPIEYDPGRHLATFARPAVELALPILAVIFAAGVAVGDEIGSWIVLASFAIGFVVACVFKSFRIDVYESGMKISGWYQQTSWLSWDEITEIYHINQHRGIGGPQYFYSAYMELKLYIHNRQVFVLARGIIDPEGLYHIIVRHVEKSLLSYYSRILQEGKVIAMGPIRVQEAGIQVHNDFVPWEDVEALKRDGHEFTLKTSTKTYRLTFKRNQDVLHRLFFNAMKEV